MICTAQRPNPMPSSLDSNAASLDNTSRSDGGSIVEEGESDVELDEDEVESDSGMTTGSVNGSESSSSVASKKSDEYMEYRLTGLTADAAYK